MGVLAGGAIYLESAKYACGCRPRLENLRISIAARRIECEPPKFWPQRGGT
jgi:hypothetical protein